MRTTVPLAAVIVFTTLASNILADPLAEISRGVHGKARRASSGLFDPESNLDYDHLQPGETKTLTTLKGPGEIRHLWFVIAGRDRRWPRTLVVRIYWDGADTPSVETPIGDFFAAGNGMRANVNSLPVQVTSYGRAMNCYWRMPFARNARIEVTNEGENRLCVYWQVDWMELPEAPEDMYYFHARYRQEFPAKPFSPYVIFEGKGEGHYVGTVFSSQCSYASWFGESDDRFYVDGEAEPSIIGTGCEDYFNDGWSFREFTNANTGVTIKEPNGEDCRFTAYRWHVRTPIPFKKSLQVEIERRSFAHVTNPTTGLREQHDFKYRPDFCSSVAFWYQETPAKRTWPFPSVEQRLNKEIILDTADMVDQIKTSGGAQARQAINRVCNLKQALYVDNDRIGGSFEVPCHVDEAGIYSISVFQCLFRDSGIWKVTLDGPSGPMVLDEAIDFYDPYLAQKENRPENFLHGTWFEKKVGLHKLSPGDYLFRFECVGANPLSRRSEGDVNTPGRNCRLDGISLRRFPWDDLYGQLQNYLAEEKVLFDGRIEEARRMVTSLDAAVRRFRLDTGEYPRTLDELLQPPERLPSSSGHWPYVDDIPRDPWGQKYRYQHPGGFHVDAFDVYSVHGNSRDPTLWIGNWNDPFCLANAIEGEDLTVTARSKGVITVNQHVQFRSPPPLSRSRLRYVEFSRKGDAINLALPPSTKPGHYRMRIRLVTARNYGVLHIKLNGQTMIPSVDTFSFPIDTKTLDIGPVTIQPGANVLRFETLGQNVNSRGCNMGIDAVTLVPAREQ